jgi:glutaminyl-peptide cyclotransferase
MSRAVAYRLALTVLSAMSLSLMACGGKTSATSAAGAAESGPAYTYDEGRSLVPQIDSDRLWRWMSEITALGPRPSGSPGLVKTTEYLERELKALGWETRRRAFTDTTPAGPTNFINLHARRARHPGEDVWARSVPLLVCSHYDTKWFAPPFHFVGANDGGSGNAACLEVARLAATQPALAERLEIVFFDGEEARVNFTGLNANPYDGLYGSRYLQKDIRTRAPEKRPKAGLLFDMIADRDLRIGIPPNSSGRLARIAMEAGQALGHNAAIGVFRSEILDDHTPLMAAGVEMTDLIDLDYQPWHTAGDVLSACSAESLKTSTRIGLRVIERLAAE